MAARHSAIRFTSLILTLALFAAGCQAELRTEEPTGSAPAQQETPDATPDGAAPTVPVGHPSWTIVRDEPSGVGFAVPCWWGVTLPGEEGYIRSITVVNYDQAYFEANSERGEWIGGEPPKGVVKFDLTIINLEDPGESNEDFARQFLVSDLQSIDSMEQITLARHRALKVTVRSTINNKTSIVYLMRPAAERMVLFAVYPQPGLGLDDIQIILGSLALESSQEIPLPVVPPGRPLPGVAPFCVQ